MVDSHRNLPYIIELPAGSAGIIVYYPDSIYKSCFYVQQ